MKSPVYPASAQQQQTQFVCWGFSVLRHIILKNADSRSVLIQLYLFMNKKKLDHRIDCTVHVVQDTHGTQDSFTARPVQLRRVEINCYKVKTDGWSLLC